MDTTMWIMLPFSLIESKIKLQVIQLLAQVEWIARMISYHCKTEVATDQNELNETYNNDPFFSYPKYNV